VRKNYSSENEVYEAGRKKPPSFVAAVPGLWFCGSSRRKPCTEQKTLSNGGLTDGSAMELAQHPHETSPAPAPATADVYEPAGGEAYVIEMHVPDVKPEEIAIEATPDSLRVTTDPQQPQDSDRIYIRPRTRDTAVVSIVRIRDGD
jgi:hypothetical protein